MIETPKNLSAVEKDYQLNALRKATDEEFAFVVPARGKINIENLSATDGRRHIYTVSVDAEGKPDSCTCPAFANYRGPCKHCFAVAQEPAIGLAATRARDPRAARGATALADGGNEPRGCVEDRDDCPGPDADHDETGLPCWECYKTMTDVEEDEN